MKRYHNFHYVANEYPAHTIGICPGVRNGAALTIADPDSSSIKI